MKSSHSVLGRENIFAQRMCGGGSVEQVNREMYTCIIHTHTHTQIKENWNVGTVSIPRYTWTCLPSAAKEGLRDFARAKWNERGRWYEIEQRIASYICKSTRGRERNALRARDRDLEAREGGGCVGWTLDNCRVAVVGENRTFLLLYVCVRAYVYKEENRKSRKRKREVLLIFQRRNMKNVNSEFILKVFRFWKLLLETCRSFAIKMT